MLLNRQEVADRLKVCVGTVKNLDRAGELEAVNVGRARRYTEEGLEDYLARIASAARVGS